jgi:hypothetical protein
MREFEIGMLDKIKSLEMDKRAAYHERNMLVCALSKVFPSHLERHPDTDKSWEDDWRWIVFIDLPTGQACWHIHDTELTLFNHLEPSCLRFHPNSWDGHTTAEKYMRLSKLPVRVLTP